MVVGESTAGVGLDSVRGVADHVARQSQIDQKCAQGHISAAH
jgi:hypothetical protein